MPSGDNIIRFPTAHDPELTYQQLAHEFGVSTRFLRYRFKEGMPSVGIDYAGKRRFRLSEARAYLDERQKLMGRTTGDAPHG